MEVGMKADLAPPPYSGGRGGDAAAMLDQIRASRKEIWLGGPEVFWVI